jgi:hypothetical protein
MIASRSGWRGGSGERARPVRYRVMDVQSCGTRTVLLVREPGDTRSAVEVPTRPDPAAAFRSLAGLRRVMEVHIELGAEARAVMVGSAAVTVSSGVRSRCRQHSSWPRLGSGRPLFVPPSRPDLAPVTAQVHFKRCSRTAPFE